MGDSDDQQSALPAPSGQKIVAFVVCAAMFILVVQLLTKNTYEAPVQGSPMSEVTTTAERTLWPAGSTVRDGGLAFRVEGIRGVTRIDGMEPKGDGFALVTVTVKNPGSTPEYFAYGSQVLIDAAGKRYGTDSRADWRLNDPVGDINPGISATVELAFDITASTRPVMVELHGGVGSAGVKVALSGESTNSGAVTGTYGP